MKNKFLSKAYGGAREARNKLNGLGLPRHWKVIASTLLLLFTFAIGNVWAAEETLTWAYSGITTACTDPSGITKSSSNATSTIKSSMEASFSAIKTKSDASQTGYSSRLQSTDGTYLGDKANKAIDANQYVGASFTIPDGYVFKLKSISFPFCAISTSISVRLTISDGETSVTPSDATASSSGTATISYNDNVMTKELSGDVTVKIWFWMPSSTSTGKYAGMGDLVITGDLVESSADPVPVTGISIAPTSATIKVGKTVKLTPTITPSNATDKAVTWAVTSGSSYASVTDAGVVTGIAVGTAVVTATAHDGSGITQTATITVEECPTSGTIFSMNITASEGTQYSGNNTFPSLIDATYVGGKAYSGSKTTTTRTSTINSNGEYPFNGHSELAIKVVMDCPFEEGDIITITNTSNTQVKMQKVVGTDLHKTANKTFTIPSGSALIGEDVFYIMRDNQSSTLKSFTVTRPLYRTITLEYADGVTPDGSIDVIDGTAATKPSDPTWAHHRFDGWYNGATPYDWTANVTGALTLTAHWTQLYTVTYAAGDGTATGDAPTQADKAAGETFNVAANPFTVAGKDFVKWNDGTNDYAPDDTYTVGTANVVLTAQWKAAADKYTVIFKDGDDVLDTKLFEVGSNPSDAGIDKTKALNTFTAWQKEGVDIALNDAFWATVAKDATVTLTARWAKAYAESIDMEQFVLDNTKAGNWQAYLDGKGYIYSQGNASLDSLDNSSGKVKNNYQFLGLKFANNSTDKYVSGNLQAGKLMIVKVGQVGNVHMKLDGVAQDEPAIISGVAADSAAAYTYWYAATDKLFSFYKVSGATTVLKAITITDPYEVSFDANGGDLVSAQFGTPSVTLPLPSKGTESFLGWFDGETKVGMNGDKYTPTANITLVAHWEAVSTDARLSAITFSAVGTLAPEFNPEVVNYTYTMPYGTASIPTITGATSVSDKAQDPIIGDAAAAWGDAQTVKGVAQSGDKKTYTITMVQAPKDGVVIIHADIPAGTSADYAATGLYAGTGNSKNEGNSLKLGENNYAGVTLTGGEIFKEGDILNIHVKTINGFVKAPISTTNAVDGSGVIFTEERSFVVGDNFITLTSAFEDANSSSLYLVRTTTVGAECNPAVDHIEVTRAMNPVLTAITIDGRDGEIDALDATHFSVTIPYEADLAALTVVPTVIRNAAHATTPEAVISNAGAWILGDNTYRVMDKDGDYTDYTITLTRDVLKHTVSFNTHGGSAVANEEVEHNAYLAAAPTAPTKEDYIFQYWSLTDGGEEVDITTVQINENKEFHAVWASDGAIKLLDGATVNHTNYITGVTADETVEFMGNTVNYAKFSGTVSGVNGVKDLTRVIAYNATTNKTKIQISAHNNSTSGRSILVKGLVEGASAAVDLATIGLGNKEDKVSEWIEFNNAANRTIYIMVSSSAGDVYFTQVKVIESGETEMKQVGEAGYALNLNKGRFFGLANTELAFEGLNARLSGDYTALNSGYAKLASTSMSFTVASDMNLVVTTNNNKTYYVTKDAPGTDNETAKTGVSEFDLTAGTWYITAGNSEVQFTNIAFELPKCQKPTIETQPATKLDFGAGDMTATVVATADGTLSYQWFNASDDSEVAGATEATLTTATEGTYYVVVTNSKAGYQDNTIKSDNAELKHRQINDATLSALSYGGTAITLEDGVYEYAVLLDEGTTVVPALSATATMAAYGATAVPTDAAAFVDYKATSTVLVTAEDGATTQTYTVKFTVQHEYTEIEDVTGNTSWNWAGVADVTEGDGIVVDGSHGLVLANYIAAVNFEKLEAHVGARAYRSNSYPAYQGTSLKFHATVAGKLVINARRSSGSPLMKVNGAEVATLTSTLTEYVTFVPAGDVTITVTGNEMRIYSMEFQVLSEITPNYTRDNLNPNNIGTLCWKNDGVLFGGTVYELTGKDENSKLVFDEVIGNVIKGGKPCIFVPENGNTEIKVYNTKNDDVDAGEFNGMKGTYEGLSTIADGENSPLWGNYIISNNKYIYVDYNNCRLGEYRAYIMPLENVPSADPNPSQGAPRRRLVVGGNQAPTVVTDVENLNASEQPVKLLINGQIFILRGEKMFDATGRLVK